MKAFKIHIFKKQSSVFTGKRHGDKPAEGRAGGVEGQKVLALGDLHKGDTFSSSFFEYSTDAFLNFFFTTFENLQHLKVTKATKSNCAFVVRLGDIFSIDTSLDLKI